MNATTIRPAPVKKTLTVKATPEKAFRVFTRDFDRWWPRTHHLGDVPMASAAIEPRTGGRWYEVREDGSQCDWGEVLAWEPPGRLLLAWRISTEWKADPSVGSEIEVLFTPLADGQTRVEFEHRGLEGLGAGAEALRAQLDGDWVAILDAYGSATQAP
jgi:uncharacterized protein YndB with AHSA1/START domain